MEIIPAQYKAFDGTIFNNQEDCLSYETQDYCNMLDIDLMLTKNIEDAMYVYFPVGQDIEKFNQVLDMCCYQPIDEKIIPYEDNTIVYWDNDNDDWANFADKEKEILSIRQKLMGEEL